MTNKPVSQTKTKGLILLALMAFVSGDLLARTGPKVENVEVVKPDGTKPGEIRPDGTVAPRAVRGVKDTGLSASELATGAKKAGDKQESHTDTAGSRSNRFNKSSTASEATVAGVGLDGGRTILKNAGVSGKTLAALDSKLADLAKELRLNNQESWNAFAELAKNLDENGVKRLTAGDDTSKALIAMFNSDRSFLQLRDGFDANGNLADLGNSAMQNVAATANDLEIELSQIQTLNQIRSNSRARMADKNFSSEKGKSLIASELKKIGDETARRIKVIDDELNKATNADDKATLSSAKAYLVSYASRTENAKAYLKNNNISAEHKAAITDVLYEDAVRTDLKVLTPAEEAYFIANCLKRG